MLNNTVVNPADDAVSEHGFKRISEIAGFSYGANAVTDSPGLRNLV